MVEDRLDTAQRIRLESVAQAMASLGAPMRELLTDEFNEAMVRAAVVASFVTGRTDWLNGGDIL